MNDVTQPHPEAQPAPSPLRELTDRFAPQLEDAQAKLEEVNETVKTFIRKNPGTTLLGAAALGFLIGKWASRR